MVPDRGPPTTNTGWEVGRVTGPTVSGPGRGHADRSPGTRVRSGQPTRRVRYHSAVHGSRQRGTCCLPQQRRPARPIALIRNAITDVWSRRRLIGYMVRADIKKRGVNTVLGNVWWVLDPLITMLIYVLVMTVIFQRSTPDFPLFLLTAMVPFKWFTATIGSSTNAVMGNEGLIKQIMFPKIILPVTSRSPRW